MIGSVDMLRMLGVKIKIFGDNTGLKQTETGIDRITNKASKLGSILAGALAFNFAKNFIKEGLDFGDRLADQAARLGIPLAALQEWSFVAEKAGVSAEAMAKSFGFFNNTLGEAQLGTKKSIETLQKLGFTPDQIKNTKNANDLMFAFADQLKALPTDAQKFAFAQRLMGKGGREVALVLAQGSEAIQQQMQDLRDMGGVLDDVTGKKADEFGDRLLLINKVYEVTKTKIAVKMIPALNRLANTFLAVTNRLSEVNEKTGIVTAVLRSLGAIATGVALKMAASWALANWPLVFMAAAGVALYYVLDDLRVFFSGKGKSALETWLNSLFGIEKGQEYAETLRKTFNGTIAPLLTMAAILDRITTTLKLISEFSIGGAFDPTSKRTLLDLRKEIAKERGISLFAPRIRQDILSATAQGQGLAGISNPVPAMLGMGGFPERPISGILRNMMPDRVPTLSGNAQPQNNNLTFNISGGNPADVEAAVGRALDKTLLGAKEDFITLKGN